MRVLCAFAVIVIHVSAQFVGSITSVEEYATYSFDYIFNDVVYNGLSRFAVPCFIMLSGAFLLDNTKNADYLYFYKKSFKKLLIPVLVFSCLYFAYDYVLIVGKTVVLHREALSLSLLLHPVKNWIRGEPFYHMWYMYMLIGLYALVPVVLRLKETARFETFEKIAFGFLLFASLASWSNVRSVNWDPGMSFDYLGYFMAGYVIRKRCAGNNRKAVLFLALGVAVEFLNTYLRYVQVLDRVPEAGRALFSPNCPLVVISSLLIFAGFASLKTRVNVSYLASLTFVIYLVHAGVLSVLQIVCGDKVLHLYSVTGDSRIIIPVLCFVTFVLSVVLAVWYNKAWTAVDRKFGVSDKIVRWIFR